MTTRSISSSGAGLPVQISNWRAPCCTNISTPVMTGGLLAGEADERRVERVVDQVEDDLVLRSWVEDLRAALLPAMPTGVELMMTSKEVLGRASA
jgi:hypothetical protein